jgi:hypothetical protein
LNLGRMHIRSDVVHSIRINYLNALC